MARRRHIVLAGDLSGWPKGITPSPALMKRLDQYSSELVNGEDGGTWSPADPIVIGPYRNPEDLTTETILFDGVGSMTGDIETVKGNSKAGTVQGFTGLVMSGGSLPEFQSARSRTIVVPFVGFTESANATRSFREMYEVDPLTLGCRGIYRKVVSDIEGIISQLEPSTSQIVGVPFPTRAQHRSATFSSFVFRVLIVGNYNAVPATPMKFRVVRVTGDTVVALHSNGGGYDANGWLSDTAATPADYMNGGQVREFTYVPDQNHTSIDPSTDFFMMQARASSDFRNSVFLSAVVTLGGITDMRQE